MRHTTNGLRPSPTRHAVDRCRFERELSQGPAVGRPPPLAAPMNCDLDAKCGCAGQVRCRASASTLAARTRLGTSNLTQNSGFAGCSLLAGYRRVAVHVTGAHVSPAASGEWTRSQEGQMSEAFTAPTAGRPGPIRRASRQFGSETRRLSPRTLSNSNRPRGKRDDTRVAVAPAARLQPSSGPYAYRARLVRNVSRKGRTCRIIATQRTPIGRSRR